MFKSKGTCFTGAKSSPEQQKKHFTMMKSEELIYLRDWAHRRPVSSMKVSRHLADKGSVTFNPYDVKRMMEDVNLDKNIIEFNKKVLFDGTISRRILIRDSEVDYVRLEDRNGKVFEADANLCIVVDLDKWCLVTAYWNLATDNHHQTINWSRYCPELKVME